jgi:hypothetical protein
MDQIQSEAKDFLLNEPLEVEIFEGKRHRERWCARLTVGPLYITTVKASTRDKMLAKVADATTRYYATLGSSPRLDG